MHGEERSNEDTINRMVEVLAVIFNRSFDGTTSCCDVQLIISLLLRFPDDMSPFLFGGAHLKQQAFSVGPVARQNPFFSDPIAWLTLVGLSYSLPYHTVHETPYPPSELTWSPWLSTSYEP